MEDSLTQIQMKHDKFSWMIAFDNGRFVPYWENWIFSSPELKAQVSFSDRPLSICLSVCKLLHFRLLLQNH
jgi:hypothetical protein